MSVIKGIFSTRAITIDGTPLLPGRSQKIINHSPDGFNWSYGGSGPAQLALALLLEFTNEIFAQLHYQSFKWSVIAILPPADFELAVSDVMAWVEHHGYKGCSDER